MFRSGAIVAAALGMLAAPAFAGMPDNLRLYSILEDSATLAIDNGEAKTLDSNSVNFYHFDPGQHAFTVTDSNGESLTLNANLVNDQMATSRGRSWWCITTGRTTDTKQLRFVLDTQAQCQAMLAVAPEKDDPNDDK